jgi:hypothetical protein
MHQYGALFWCMACILKWCIEAIATSLSINVAIKPLFILNKIKLAQLLLNNFARNFPWIVY